VSLSGIVCLADERVELDAGLGVTAALVVGTMASVVHAVITLVFRPLSAVWDAVCLWVYAAAPDTNPDTNGYRPSEIPHEYTLGVARARWPIRSSKPAGRCNPTVGRFDSCAAPLAKYLQKGMFFATPAPFGSCLALPVLKPAGARASGCVIPNTTCGCAEVLAHG
jgi:hypothetical protein